MKYLKFGAVALVGIFLLQGCFLEDEHERAINDCYDYPNHECPSNSGNGGPPIAEEGSARVETNGEVEISLNAVDRENDPISFRIVQNPSLGTLTGSGAERMYYAGEATGVDTFTFIATDGKSDSEETVYTVTVAQSSEPEPEPEPPEVNNPPVANPGAERVSLGESVRVTLDATDPDGDTLSFRIVRSPSLGTLTGSGSARVYYPDANQTGIDKFTFIASDGKLDSRETEFTITIVP